MHFCIQIYNKALHKADGYNNKQKQSFFFFFFYRADSSVVLVTTIIYEYIAKLLRVASLYVALYTSPAFLLMRTESNGSSGVFFLFLQTKCSVKEKSLSKAVQSSGWDLFS